MNHQQEMQWLAYAASRRPEFLEKFNIFCQLCKKSLTNNAEFPGISFSIGDSGDAHLSIFDQRYEVRFHILSVDVPNSSDHVLSGVIVVSVPRTNLEDETIWRVFIDHLGNVKNTPMESMASHHVADLAFVAVFLADVSNRHFARLNAKFLGEPPRPK